jgi:dolichol-phosphate mannosyltransferase
VIPVFNEQDTLSALYERLCGLLANLDGDAEVILVDDGSRDNSLDRMLELHARDPRFRVIKLARNFGHQMAITAGIDLAEGQAVVVMDADLQDPPEVVLEMAARWREGYEIVYGVREDRTTDSWFKRTTARAFYRILGRLADIDIPMDTGDFRLIDRRAVEAFKGMREGSRFVRGMFGWMGFRKIGVPYARAERYAGETKYPVRKMAKLAMDALVGFSRVPLRLAMSVGFVCSMLAIAGGASAVFLKVFGIYSAPGWTSVIVVVSLLGGLQLGVMGVIGEYLARTYEEALHRPLYIVSDLHGVRTPIDTAARSVIALPRTVASILGTDEADLRANTLAQQS